MLIDKQKTPRYRFLRETIETVTKTAVKIIEGQGVNDNLSFVVEGYEILSTRRAAIMIRQASYFDILTTIVTPFLLQNIDEELTEVVEDLDKPITIETEFSGVDPILMLLKLDYKP